MESNHATSLCNLLNGKRCKSVQLSDSKSASIETSPDVCTNKNEKTKYPMSNCWKASVNDELFSFSFSRSTSKMTVSSLILVEKPKTGVLNPFDVALSESLVSKDGVSNFNCRAPRYAINPRIAAYIDGEKCAWSNDTLTQTCDQKKNWETQN